MTTFTTISIPSQRLIKLIWHKNATEGGVVTLGMDFLQTKEGKEVVAKLMFLHGEEGQEITFCLCETDSNGRLKTRPLTLTFAECETIIAKKKLKMILDGLDRIWSPEG